MSVTMTTNLDADAHQLAEQEAKPRHTTVPNVVARNWQESQAGRPPVTDALRGGVALPPDFAVSSALTEGVVGMQALSPS